MFNSSGSKSEWYLKLYEDESIILKFPRNEYLEAYSLFYPNYDTIYQKSNNIENLHVKRMYLRVKRNEYETWEYSKDTVMINKIQKLTWN